MTEDRTQMHWAILPDGRVGLVWGPPEEDEGRAAFIEKYGSLSPTYADIEDYVKRKREEEA